MNLFSAFSAILVLSHFSGIEGASRPQNRIVNGDPCYIYDAPHVVQLNMKYTTPTETNFCGGSLVTAQHILTSAHCLDGYVFSDLTLTDIITYIILGLLNPGALLDPTYGDPLEVYVVAGSDFLVTDPENPDSTSCRRRASRENFRIHEDYDPETLEHDIGVIKLPNQFTLTDCPDAKCILLPNLDEVFEVNTEIAVAGFGLTSDDGDLSEDLMCGRMKIVEDRNCIDVYEEDYNPDFTILCVTAVDNDYFCDGDSGSAMFTRRRNALVEVCIATFAHTDSCENYPQACTEVSPYINWICEDPDFIGCPTQVTECLT